MNTTLNTVIAQVAPPPPQSPSMIMAFLPLLAIIALVFIFIRRPANKLQAKVQGASPESKRVSKFMIIGVIVGGFIGFLLRPAVALVGQLPFTVVITRGATLQGLDQLLVPAAQTSFNYMLVGWIVGAVAGFLATKVIASK
jgi:hypothetical protein